MADKTKEQLMNELAELRQRVAELEASEAERKQAEEALRISEEKFYKAFHTSPDSININRLADGMYIEINQGFTALTGYTAEDVKGKTSLELDIWVDPQDRARLVKGLQEQGHVSNLEVQFRLKDGRVKTGLMSARIIEIGGERCILSITRDISERKRAEEALRESEVRFRTIFENSMDGLFLTAPDGRILAANPAACEMLGRSEAELCQIGRSGVVDVQDPRLPSMLEERARTGKARGELAFFRKDGTRFEAELTSVVFDTVDGPRTSMIVRDITERKQAEEEIRRHLQEMTLLNRIVTAISSATNMDEALQNICAELARFLQVPQAGFAMLNPQRTAAEVIADYYPPGAVSAIGWTLPVINNPSMAYVLEHKVPLAIVDAQHDPLLTPIHDIMRQRSTQSLLIVPIIANGEVIGTIGFDAFQRREFSAAEIELVQYVAGHIGQMLMRKQAEEALRRERDLARALEEAAAVLSSTLDLNQVLDRILEQVSRVVPNDAANIMLVQGNQARIVRWRGYERFGAEEFVSTVAFNIPDVPNLRQMLESKEPMVIPDTATYPGWVHVPVQEWLRSYAAVPIIVHDEVIGFLNVDSATPGFFTQAHAEDLRAFADHAAVAIQNARLFEAQRRRSAELEILRQASLRLTSTLELQPILEAILDHALQLMSADDAHVFLYDGQQLTFGAALWAGGRQQKPYSEPRPHGLTYTVARSGERIVIPDMSDHPLFRDRQWQGAIVGLPLRIGERVVGVMNIASQKPSDFDENELRALELLADQSAIAIENARLYEAVRQELAERQRAEAEIRKRTAQLEALRAVGLEITAQLDLDTLLRFIVSRAVELLGGNAGGLYLYRPEQDVLEWAMAVGPSMAPLGAILHRGEGLSGKVWDTGEPIIVDNYQLWEGRAAIYDGYPWQAVVGVPVYWGEEFLGVLNVNTNLPHIFSPDDAGLLSLFATQAAIALRNARLYEAAQQELAERKRTEEALRESEEKYRNLVERANDGIVIVQDALLKYANSRLAEITGYTVEEMIGTPYADYIHPDELPKVVERYERRMAGEEVRSIYETALKRKNGSRVDVELNAGIITFQGKPADLVFVRDISERKRLEEQLLQAQKMEAVGRLAGGVAHDFNNLLTAIIGYSELLLMSFVPGNPRRKDVEEIKKAADRAAALTRQLLAFSRKQMLQPQVLNLNLVVTGIEKMLRRMIGEDIELVTILDAELGLVKADPGQIDQVIMNLAVNARDAMPQGGKLTIETKNAYLDEEYAQQHVEVQPGPYVMLAMSDTGVGMDEEIKSHLFEPFFTTKEVGKGTGLGLATVYGIIKQSGGHIWVYSEPGQGTTFKIYLPMIEGVVEPAGLPLPPDETLHGAETILLVEDDSLVRELASRVLIRHGYLVLEAYDGEKALRICQEYQKPIHLLVTDVVMPGGMSGRQLAENMTTMHPETRVLYMSGYTDNAIVHHGMLKPGITFLQKPFTPEALARKVREVLKGGK